jgi:integrase
MYISRNTRSGIYYIYYRKDDGKKTRVSTRTKLKREAMKYLKDFDKKLNKSSQQPSFTMNDLKVKYLNVIEITHTKNSWRNSRQALEKLISFVGSNTQVRDVSKSMAESFILSTYQRAKYTASLYKRNLHAVFNRAIDWGYIEKNPFKGIKLSIPENHPVFINKKELNMIVKQERDPTLAMIYKFAYYTGMRQGEVINLEWNDIDLKRKVIKVRSKQDFKTKSKREREIPIAKPVKKILNLFNGRTGYVFNKNGDRYSGSFLAHRFKKVVRALGMNDDIHFHSLRHSFASNLVQKGVSINIVKELLGHSNISVTMRYAHLDSSSLVSAVKLLD